MRVTFRQSQKLTVFGLKFTLLCREARLFQFCGESTGGEVVERLVLEFGDHPAVREAARDAGFTLDIGGAAKLDRKLVPGAHFVIGEPVPGLPAECCAFDIVEFS